MKPVYILYTEKYADDLMAKVQNVSSKLVIMQHEAKTVAEVPDEIWAKTEILYTRAVLPSPALAQNLRWVHLHGAGADKITNSPLANAAVIITNGSGIHAPTMGEYVLMLLLSFGYRFRLLLDFQGRAEWAGPTLRGPLPRRELRRATIGIIGYGSLGQEIGRLAHAFGMHVLGVNRTGVFGTGGYVVPELADQPGTEPDELYPIDALFKVLPRCDYVVLTVPYTPATHRLIDKAALQMMKPEAVLVNVSRGTVVDEPALIQALQGGSIAGAALDVFEQEPLPSDSPLWQMDNVIISPHVSGWTPRYDVRATDLFLENVKLYLQDKPLLNQVEPALGY
jgi:phosphoglycerate dehydrogenase-like enzyme